ncbi:MFS general substrate transporter [Periconia macrospinosa]|uniref:MFS general substrate transporter n=1 Tax=Periconia macrospinosa TaxID=97972 RepID=A0A2V1DVB5_9PLEO|nr:MFS general substrate transporter [Periconia macrospinosa]
MATQTATELQTFEPATSTSGATLRKNHEMPAEVELSPAAGPTASNAATTAGPVLLSKGRAGIVIAQVCGLSFFSSFCNGVIVIALPAMQSTLGLEEGLLVWPSSSYFLTAGSCLLLAGSVADVVGNKQMNLIGSFFSAIFAMACGLARTGGQIIAFRALQGITYAIIIPSSISIISNNLEEGRPRNMGFACMGFSQPLGFCFGLVLAGVFTDTVGWRPAFYLAAAASGALFLISIWTLPRDIRPEAGPSIWKRLALEIDCVGVFLASMGLAMSSYVLASLSANINNIHKASSIVLLIITGLSIPLFVGWMHHQVKNNRTALIPNSLWRSHVFTSCCVMVLLTNALTNCMELYSSLFFQQVQGTSALRASLQVVPSLVAGALTSIATGIFVHRMPVLWMLLISSAMSTVAPLLMAVVRTDQLYWENAFFAQILTPISCDLLFTVGLLIISDVFPKHMQALSGAVFNTCAQLGTAIGLSATQVIASSVTNDSSYANKSSPDALMEGYRAAFWTMFGWMVFVCLVCVVGMRRVGVIGVKRD